MVETRGAGFHKEAQQNMDDRESDPITDQPEARLTN